MDIVNKAIAKASGLASETAWNAQQKIKVNTEEKRLDDLRNKTILKRAEIGDAMYKLWQSHKLPPSQLDDLFYELQDLIDASTGAADNLSSLKAETYEQAVSAQAQTATSYAAAIPAAPSSTAQQALPSGNAGAPPLLLDSTPEVPLVECQYCHSMVRADRNFCGRCGHQIR